MNIGIGFVDADCAPTVSCICPNEPVLVFIISTDQLLADIICWSCFWSVFTVSSTELGYSFEKLLLYFFQGIEMKLPLTKLIAAVLSSNENLVVPSLLGSFGPPNSITVKSDCGIPYILKAA